MSIERNVFPTSERLAKALADAVAEDLQAGLAERGVAALAVSGGSTPALFFETLAQREDIDWADVVVTLVDERWVPRTAERSNARLVEETLLQGPAAAASFVPLYTGGDAPTPGQVDLAARLIASDLPRPFDAVVLGMGMDGHTASFFPGGNALEEALTAEGPLVAIEAPGAGEPRVTFTLPRLLDTRSLYLHIEGDEKARIFDQALTGGPVETMPVRAVLDQTAKTLSLYWCP